MAKAKELEVNVSTLINLRLIRRNSSLYESIGEEMVQRTIYGVPLHEDWSNCSYDHASFRTKYLSQSSLALCQRSQAFRERAMRIVRGTMELGFTSLFIDQSFDGNPCFAGGHGHRSPDDTHEAAINWIAEAADLVKSKSPESYVVGESTDLFGMAKVNISWNWGWISLAPEVMRYALPKTVHYWVVDRQPEVLNRAFVMGFLMALNTHQAERTLDDYPQFGRRVAELATLRLACSDYVAKGRFLDDLGLDLKGCLGFVYDSPAGLAVAFAETKGKPSKVTATLHTNVLGRKPTHTGRLFKQEGTSRPAGTVTDERINIEFDLDPLEVAIWTVPCDVS